VCLQAWTEYTLPSHARDAGDHRDALILCLPERSARERAHESKDPVQPLVTMLIQGVLPKHFSCFFPRHLITRHVGDLRDALSLCHPERRARDRARESKDPVTAVGDRADSGSSTETLFLLFPDHP
jgi:hypothetical protein